MPLCPLFDDRREREIPSPALYSLRDNPTRQPWASLGVDIYLSICL
jgi:hypothetical protein